MVAVEPGVVVEVLFEQLASFDASSVAVAELLIGLVDLIYSVLTRVPSSSVVTSLDRRAVVALSAVVPLEAGAIQH